MRKKRTEAFVILFCGLVCICAACYIYFVAHTIYPGSDSTRILDLNRLLKTFGKAGTASLVALPGLVFLYVAAGKFRNKG